MLDAGKSSENIAECLFLSCNTVTNYLKKISSRWLRGLNMSGLLILKPRLSSFFANIKQYRPELESLMRLKFHTLGT